MFHTFHVGEALKYFFLWTWTAAAGDMHRSGALVMACLLVVVLRVACCVLRVAIEVLCWLQLLYETRAQSRFPFPE